MRCGNSFHQFYLLLWKNFILQIRRPIGTIFELILPICAVALVIVIRYGFFSEADNCFVTFEPDTLQLPAVTTRIFYSPNGTDTDKIMDLVRKRFPQAQTTPYSSENAMLEGIHNWRRNYTDELEDFFSETTDSDDILRFDTCVNGYGVVFDSLGNNIEYTIRPAHEVKAEDDEPTWRTDIVQPRFQAPGPRVSPNLYLSEGFLHLQNLLGMSIVEWRVKKSAPNYTFTEIPVHTKQFPYPPHTRNPFLEDIERFLPLLLVLSLIWSAGIFVWELVSEKQSRMRESMKMMGLSNWILWLTWYIKQFLFLLTTVIIMTVLLKLQVFENSNPVLLLIFLILFINCLIAQSFLISVFFSKSILGLLFGFLLWFVAFIPYFFIANRYERLDIGVKILACFLSNTCMGLGVNVLSTLEIRGEGVQGYNVGSALSPDDSFNLAAVYGMLILDSIIYMLIAWYIDAVFPGEYGIPKPFYFFLTPSYWLGQPIGREKSFTTGSSLEMSELSGFADKGACEAEPTDLSCGITVKGLTKVYKASIGKKVAVDNLYLNMYQDQITVLLGHNGAGKTTTMSMLVGLFPPTSGDAVINGHSIINDIDGVRESLGLCPQHNVLFDRLTVREHLTFFARLKGMSGKRNVKNEVNSMISDLQLNDKANQRSAALSGGQKRKLSVGIALVAGSKFVILDEPTSGMDPYARRATWDLLSKHKKGRTMLLTTHFMDEADLLGDRIAIMAEGQLRCSGSSLFLKSRYGVGYHMVVTKEAKCDSSKVIQVVTTTIAGSKMVTDVGAELSFILPNSGSSQFPILFDKLEAHKAEYGISGFGVSITTMEEVFIKVGEGLDEALEGKMEPSVETSGGGQKAAAVGEEENKSPPDATTSFAEPDVELPGAIPTDTMRREPGVNSPTLDDSHQFVNDLQYDLNTGLVLWVQQFYALLVKRFLHSIRNWRAIITQVVLPTIFILLGLILVETIPAVTEPDELRSMSLQESALVDDDIVTFYAEFGSGPQIFEDPESIRSTIGATALRNFTADIQKLMNELNSITNAEDCCNYRYQMLDTYCASRTGLNDTCGGNYRGYSNCGECYNCQMSASSGNHLPTCTYPLTRDNEIQSNDLFCPYPPSVSIADSTITPPGRPLDYISYYMDEHLISTADRTDTIEFFRSYMAGFLISKRERAMSLCGLDYVRGDDDNIPDTEDLMCMMYGATTLVRTEEFFYNSMYRLNATDDIYVGNCLINEIPLHRTVVDCTISDLAMNYMNGSQYPDCNDIGFEINKRLNSTSNTYYADLLDATTDITMELEDDDQFQVDGAVRESVAFHAVPREYNSTFGRRHFDFANSEIAGVTIYYNNQPFHTPAASLNAFHNIYLRHLLSSEGGDYSINVNNHPLPRTGSGEVSAAENDFLGFSLSIVVIFGLSFLAASFILYPVAEKASKAKHIQFVSGVHITSFWLSAFLWDLINSFVAIIIGVILFAAFPNDSYRENIGAVFLLLFFFCWCSIPVVYAMSFMFSNALIAFALTILLFFFSALFCLIIIFVVDQDVGEVFNYLFLVFPSYAFSQGLGIIHTNHGLREVCQEQPAICAERDILYADNALDFRFPGVGANVLTMALEGILFFVITVLLEQNFFIHKIAPLLRPPQEEPVEISPNDDSDVAQEKTRLNSGEQLDDIIQIKNIKKKYGGFWFPSKYAVRGLSLGIPKGECFGLLGVNGAGKTTTFNMLTGDIRPSSGTATISGYDITKDIREVQRRIGYCPQFDALIDDMTSYELLRMYARLRGIPEDKIQGVVETEIKRLDLTKHAERLCGTYSGGNKRKLSTAIALVGSPLIVFLDEPTSGMDPATRRNLWNALITVIKAGKSIVLTSHSMEECEALCTRLAIMVNGQFKCLGGIQHLKTKFGRGFTLQVKIGSPDDFIGAVSEPVQLRRQESKTGSLPFLSRSGSRFGSSSEPPSTPRALASPVLVEIITQSPAVVNFHDFIKDTFENSTLIEEHQGAISYQLAGQNATWSYIFRKLEENKDRLLIVDYSVSQTTLEQVFLNFAKDQLFEEQ